MDHKAVRANYSELGTTLIEKMYSADYLSIGGKASTRALAELAGIESGTRVLDIGSGVGGPALYLAQTFACRVDGVDLVESNVEAATRRAALRQLDALVTFTVGDATYLPFADAQFDTLWGQDAWCHIGDKAALLDECARVLKPEGTIAFTDWLQTGEMHGEYLQQVLSASASSNLQTLDGYCAMLEQRGFAIDRRDDISDEFIDQYRVIVADLVAMRAALSAQYSDKIYAIMLDKNSCILHAFEDRKLGGGRVVAKKLG
ncbi:MAG: ubiquinone/menaquinone biosynthesis C-methylase UbiE [Gammaproteobacteria bacterium]|jgi:ubiquinone/menaquinone biosynthesis C-methylase UbiE